MRLATVLCVLAVLFGSCRRSAPAPKPEPAAQILVICVGGLGSDQTTDLAAAIRLDTRTIVISPASWNAYLVDLKPIAMTHPAAHIVLIGHSKAGWAICKLADELQAMGVTVDLMVILDGVSVGNFSLTIPSNVRYCVAYYAAIPTFGIVRAKLNGPHDEVVLPRTTHNQVPDHPDVTANVTSLIAKL
jgi:hypothetical protein